MTEQPYAIRLFRDGDETLLQSFSCAGTDGAPWQREVEFHIRHDLVYWLTAPGAQVDDPRALLVIERDSGNLAGVVAHRRADLVSASGDIAVARELHVVALASEWQGRTFADERRASDVLMTAALTDIGTRPGRLEFVHALVHCDNVRSLAMCRRSGLTTETNAGSYLRMITPPLPEDDHPELD